MDFSKQLVRLYSRTYQQRSFDPDITVLMSFQNIVHTFGDPDRHTATPNKPHHFSYDISLVIPVINIHSGFIRIYDWSMENPELLSRKDPSQLFSWHIESSSGEGIEQIISLLEHLGYTKITIHPSYERQLRRASK